MRASGLLFAFAVFVAPLMAAAIGMFQGNVVHPDGTDASPKWLYVESHSGQLRRVNISRATVSYDEGIPQRMRAKKAADSLASATKVRVTAEQDPDGEWQGKEVVILSFDPVSEHPKHRQQGPSEGVKTAGTKKAQPVRNSL
jgi:hypothetical protein